MPDARYERLSAVDAAFLAVEDGAPMRVSYPVVPLIPAQALGVAPERRIDWGVGADRDAVPDLHAFVDELQRQFAALRKAAS